MENSQKMKSNNLSWKMSPEDLQYQIDNYSTLKITKSARGVVVLIMSVLLLFSIIIAFAGISVSLGDVLISLIVYIPILLFVYKGHRWAMIALFILWTIEKLASMYFLIQAGGSSISPIVWWILVAPYIYKAWRVENARRELAHNSVKVSN